LSGQVTPFVIGVLGSLSGVPAVALPTFRDRRFVTVTRESFDRFLARMRPRLTPSVPSETEPAGVLKLELTFDRVEDFPPEDMSGRPESSNALEPDVAQRVADALAGDEAFQSL